MEIGNLDRSPKIGSVGINPVVGKKQNTACGKKLKMTRNRKHNSAFGF